MSGKILVKQESDSAKPFLGSQANEREGTSAGCVTPVLVIAVAASLLGSSIPAGYCLGVINTPQEIIRQWVRRALMDTYELELTEKVEVSVWAVVVSLFIGGAITGASLGGRLTDAMGRRMSLLMNHLLCLISGIFLMSCKFIGSVEMLVIGRFMSGLYTGLATCIVPTYLSEVAPAELKGVMGVVFPLGMTTGVVLSQVLGLDSILGECFRCYTLLLFSGIGKSFILLILIRSPAEELKPSSSESKVYKRKE